MLRRLHHTQPDSFAFTPDNLKWAEAQIAKYPEGRQASAVIPLLWRGQEQEGWVSRPMIESVADMLGLADIRVLEVATFYFMFHMRPMGSVAHFQICGTTSCMICGAEDLVAVCKDRISPQPHTLSPDGKFSWEEVECLGACSNAPMAQIGKDYYEDLTAERFGELLDAFAAGEVPTPGSQTGRFASEPVTGLTSLETPEDERMDENASVALARALGDTIERITDGRGVSRSGPAGPVGEEPHPDQEHDPDKRQGDAADAPRDAAVEAVTTTSPQDVLQSEAAPSVETAEDSLADCEVDDDGAEAPKSGTSADTRSEGGPERLSAPRGEADDLKRIKGVGPKLEAALNDMGIYHFDQIAAWSPEDVAWVDDRLNFKGRIERDGWIAQARKLSA